jgi:hypothetical protein
MTNHDEWFYRERSDHPEPPQVPVGDSREWVYRDPGDQGPHESWTGNQAQGSQPANGWQRTHDDMRQSAREPWAETDRRRLPSAAPSRYDAPPPRDDYTQWDMPASRGYQQPSRDHQPPGPGYQQTLTGNRPQPPKSRPRTQAQRARQEEPRTSPRLWWGMVAMAAALGLLLDSLAVAKAPTDYAVAALLFWPAAVLPNVAFAAVLLSRRLSLALRHFTIALVGIYSAVLYKMSSPFIPGGFDEHLHERTLSDLLHGSGLFAPNPLLNVSPNYPGMELFTGIVARLTGSPSMLAATLVVLLCRYLLVLAIYECARTVNASPRFASLVVLLYATSPQFFFFNSQFAYQTMAVPLGLCGLLLVRRAQLSHGPAARRLVGAGILILTATVVTHHITSWFVFAFLVAWAVLTPRERRRQVTIACIGMGTALAIWTGAIFGKMWNYMVPVLQQSVDQALGLLTGSSSSSSHSPLGGTTAGIATPEWQKAILVLYALAYTSAAVVFGFILIRRSLQGRGRVLGLVGLCTFVYPASLAAHFVSSAASIGDRASTFLFLPLALAVSLVIVKDPRVAAPQRTRRDAERQPVKPRLYGAFALTIGLAYLGGILLGAGPSWALLPGSFMVVADSRSQDSQTLAAVKWADTHLAPGSHVVADRVPADLLSGEARLWPLLGPQNGADWASIYFAAQWSSYQTTMVRQAGISYIYVDERLADSLPNEGYYIYQGETQNPTRLTKQDLSKFASVPGLKAVYRSGPISIYSTVGLDVPLQTSGYTSNRKMGFGPIGDAIFGIVVVLLLYALRRRLRWAVDAIRDSGPIGGIAAITSVVIFLGFILFGLNITPGPGFTVAAVLTAAILFIISRSRHGATRVATGRWQARVDPLFIVAVLVAVVAIAISLRAAWVLDVADVNNILRSAQ